MKRIYYLCLLFGLILFIACEEETTPLEVGTNPTIESIQLKQKWNSQSSAFNKVEVKVNDPQGFSNLVGVFMEVNSQATNQTIFFDSLYDDGAYFHTQDGDVIARDGVFSNKFSSTQILGGSVDDEVVFKFTAYDEDEHTSQSVEQIVLFNPNVRPEILNLTGNDTLFSGTKGQVFQTTVFDSNGIDDIVSVYFEIKDSLNNAIEGVELYNDGDFTSNGDLFADDSIYSIKLDSTYGANRKGNYRFEFHVKDSFNEENLFVPIHPIYIDNKAGKIISTTVPDSTGRPADLLLYSLVTDPQGLSDVDSVYFLLEKPDGTFGGNGAKFDLQDNGEVFYGDLIAGDGIYSKIISIASTNDPGIYIFHFYMRDEVGHLTPVTRDSIMVY